MSCPTCKQEGTIVNEIDESVCCMHCGTVIEGISLEADLESTYKGTYSKEVDIPKGHKICLEWFMRICSYFGVGPELVELGKSKLDENDEVLLKLHPKEVAIGTLIRFGRSLKPTWTYDDYIASFPLPLYKPAVIKTYLRLGGENYDWNISSQYQFDYTIDRIYNDILDQLFIKKPPNNQFNIDILKEYSRKLLELGGNYGLNSGKKIRSMIIVVALICSVYLRTKVSKKYISGTSRSTKKNSTKLSNNSNNYYYKWSYEPFTFVSYCTVGFLRKCYQIYYRLLTLAVREFKWLNQPVEYKQVYFHLDDILDLYLKKSDQEEPIMKLESSLFYPSAYVESVLKYQSDINNLIKAKDCLEKGQNPNILLEDSIAYCYYRLLKEGYPEKELSTMHISHIRNLTYILDYRMTFENIHEMNSDLDREVIDEDDMCDKELELYMN